MKLNLGGGEIPLEGYENIDRKVGKEVYPLDVEDDSCDEIRASHVLEHFSHLKADEVLKHWISKLKPGGCLKVAVPDFLKITELYQAGHPVNIQGYVMGGHADENDHHGTIYDRESLTEALITCGLERIRHWKSEIKDCASLPISLNLLGYKTDGGFSPKGVSAILSAPRYGPILFSRCAMNAFMGTGIRWSIGNGAYWHHVLSNLMQKVLDDPANEFVITTDYDSVFSVADVAELVRLIRAVDDADAVVSIQCKRGSENIMVTPLDGRRQVEKASFQRNLYPIKTGHFGLTIFRCDAIRRMNKPWFQGVAGANGDWLDGHVDPDINFWLEWQRAGNSAYAAPGIVIGHLVELIKFPDQNMNPLYQELEDYDKEGVPAAAWAQ